MIRLNSWRQVGERNPFTRGVHTLTDDSRFVSANFIPELNEGQGPWLASHRSEIKLKTLDFSAMVIQETLPHLYIVAGTRVLRAGTASEPRT